MAHTERVEAQCYAGGEAPPLGALLRIGAPPVYAVVRSVWNEPLDPAGRWRPEGASWNRRTKFTPPTRSSRRCWPRGLRPPWWAAGRGAASGGACRRGRRTCTLLCFSATAGETAEFAGELGWLRLLLADRAPAADAALAAFLRRAAAADAYAADRGGFLRRAGRILATELAGEPQRLQAILRELAL